MLRKIWKPDTYIFNGGFHLHLLVFSFIYQFIIRMNALKLRLSFDLSCVTFGSFNFMIIFKTTSADIGLKELKIAQLGS